MGGRAALLVVLVLVTTCAWANPISRDNLNATSAAPQGPAGSVSTESPSVVKNETSSKDAPKPAQSSAKAAEEEEAEPPVTEAADSLKKDTVASAPAEAAEKVAVAAKVEEAIEESPVTEKVEVENVAVPAEVEKIKEKSPVSKKVAAKTEDETKVDEAKEETTVTETVDVEKIEVAAEKESTVVEKADIIDQSEAILSEEVTTSAPINEDKAVEKASPTSPEELEIAEEEVTTVSPAADEEIIEERLPSAQVESDAPEATEKSEIEVESSKQKEKEIKPVQDAAPVVEKSIDGAKTRDEEQSPATEAIPAATADKIKVKAVPVNDVAAALEEEIVVTEVAIEATTVFEEEGQESVEVTTLFDDSSDREDATEDPSDRTAAESSGVEIVTSISVESEDGSFRQGDIDITEAPEEEDISSTTAIPQSEQDIDAEIRGDDEATVEPSTETPIDRMDSSTDIIYVDVTTEQPEETTEELIQAESLLRKIEVEEDAATDAPDAEKEESDSIDMREDEAQAITTEATLEETTEITSSQTFDDAAQIKVVEIKESVKPVESIVPADSAPIEIVEITEKPQLLAKDTAEEKVHTVDEKKKPALDQEIFQTTEIIPDEKEEATTISSESPAIRDKQEKPSSSGSEQDQEPDEEEEKPNSSKIQPAQAEDYWLSMKAEGNKSALVPVKPSVPSSNAEEVAVVAVEEAKDAEVNIRGSENLTSTAIAASAAVAAPSSVVAPAADVAQESTIDDEIAKVAQKYGLQSVGKVTTEQKPVQQVASDAQVVVSDADVPKEDSIYLGNESKKSDFQESNDLQRRHSFGDKVVRFVRSFL